MVVRTTLMIEDQLRDVLSASNVSYQDVFNYGILHMGLNGNSKDKRFLNFLRHVIEDRIEENKRLANNLSLIIAKMDHTEENKDRPKIKVSIDGEIEQRDNLTERAVAWIMDPENKAYSVVTLRDILCLSIEYDSSRFDEIPKESDELFLYLKQIEKSPFHSKLWGALSHREDINDLIITGHQKAEEWLRSDQDAT
jgi:hypothetical protein